MEKNYAAIKVQSKQEPQPLPRLSLTSDIVAYHRCPRQYSFFNEKGFVPAHAVQLYYGTILHEVLDRAHYHYKGFDDPKTKGKLPTKFDIERFFNEVDSSLKARGIRAINQDLRKNAVNVLKLFNDIEGPSFYPRVIDTEHRVRGNRKKYLMEGVVDVLVDSNSNPNKSTKDPSKWEIWDYKGQRRPKKEEELEIYYYQMQVYCALYKIKNGCLPKAAKLYFLNELLFDPTPQSKTAVLEVTISSSEINKAIKNFDNTAAEIIRSKETLIWKSPSGKEAENLKENTCSICDLRWGCPTWKKDKFPMRYP